MANPNVAEKYYPGRWVVYKVTGDNTLHTWTAPQGSYAEALASAERAVRSQPDDRFIVAYTGAAVRADKEVKIVVETT